ncbi:SPOR domain-containing protein [Kordiimonas pumila]|uniref:Tetratricopeptide repeat protein n=1 Tax=Kordiimonas pumila TaxID=2161677 RepID=A0ABV7D4D0_9PROT|nr:SPOR domain-containing protein [Kordiimonas pumila]
MITIKHIRPALIGASVLALTACSNGGYTASNLPHASQAHSNTPSNELQRIADQLAKNGDHKAAIPIYRHLASKDGSPTALDALAASLLAQGLSNEAAKTANILVERGAATGKTWYILGKVHLGNSQYEESLSAFEQALTRDPNNAQYTSGKAIALAASGNESEAISALGNKLDPLSLSNKALIFAANGHTEAAVIILEPLITQGTATARDRQNLAMAYLLNGQEEKAYQVSRIDLDAISTNETFTFYRSLASLDNAKRMQALITGTVKPEWSRGELANLELQDNSSRKAAAQRVVEPVMVATANPSPEPQPQPKVAENREDYALTEIPPLVEPEGWALQIGAYRTLKHLMRGWTLLYRQSGDLLADVPPRRSEVDFGEQPVGPKGFYYRLNAGPLKSFSEAKALCNALKERGTKCWIRPPEKTEGALPPSAENDTSQV